MAKKFLVPIDLQKNSLLNATLHPSGTTPSSPVAGQVWFDSNVGQNVLKVYNGTSWITLADAASAGVTSLTGTSNEIEVSASSGAVTIGLPDNVTIGGALTVTGDLTVNGTTTTLNTTDLVVEDNIIVLNSNVTGSPTLNAGIEVERGTSTNSSLIWDETADKWKAGLAGSETEISLAGHTHASTDITDWAEAVQDTSSSMITGATHSGISVSYNDGAGTLAITNTGVTSVNGNTGSVSATNLLDAIKTVDGSGSGLDADTLDGHDTSYFAVAGHSHTASDITDFDEAAQDAVGGIVSGSNSLAVTYTDATPSITFDTTLATTSYMSKSSGLAVDISALETKLSTDGYTKKYSASVGDGSNTSYAVTHSLGTRDVTVNVYDNSTYDTVECDVVRTSTSVVTVTFSTAPSSNAYRVVVVG